MSDEKCGLNPFAQLQNLDRWAGAPTGCGKRQLIIIIMWQGYSLKT